MEKNLSSIRIPGGMLKGIGKNVVKGPKLSNNMYPNINSASKPSLEEENRRLKATLAQKDQLIRSYQSRIETLEKKNKELQDKLKNIDKKRSKTVVKYHNNQHNNPSMYQGHYYDDFSDNFYNNPDYPFSDSFFKNTGNTNYQEPYQMYQETSNIEDDIINQLCPNPDNMTYEQLLALEEDLGSVSKGLSKIEISVK